MIPTRLYKATILQCSDPRITSGIWKCVQVITCSLGRWGSTLSFATRCFLRYLENNLGCRNYAVTPLPLNSFYKHYGPPMQWRSCPQLVVANGATSAGRGTGLTGRIRRGKFIYWQKSNLRMLCERMALPQHGECLNFRRIPKFAPNSCAFWLVRIP